RRASSQRSRDGLPQFAVQLRVALALAEHVDERRAVRRERPLKRAAEVLHVARALVGELVETGGGSEVEPGGRGYVASVDVLAVAPARVGQARELRARHGQEVEDAAAAIVEQHDHESQAEAARGEQSADVVRERDV